MAGPISTVFGVLNSNIAAGLAALTPPLVATYGTTAKERFFDSAPPRVVWYPDSEGYGPPQGQGGDIVVDSTGNMNIVGKAPIATRNVGAVCVLWGRNTDDVEAMLNVVYGVVHNILGPTSYADARGQWLVPENKTNYFDSYELRVNFLVPVPRLELDKTTATITSIPETPQMNH